MDYEWSGTQLALSARDLAAWEGAEQKIKANRCGVVIVRVVDDNGQPLRGVPVRYEQLRHSFRFGVQYPYHRETYDLLEEAGINAATLWLGWKHVQPESGVFNWGYLERVWHPPSLHRRGLRLTAHALNWFKPGWSVLPQYLLDAPVSELPELVYEHVGQVARRWSSYIEGFELVNEPFWADANALPMPLEDMARICQAAALAVLDVVPNARLEVNFAEVSRTRSYYVFPFDMLEALDKAGVPYNSIGVQALENAYTVTDPPTFFRTKTFTGMLQALSSYAKMGKPLNISALCVPSEPPSQEPPSRFKLPSGPWDEPTQASYLDAAYTLFFAQPTVEGITWRCPVDGRLALIPGGGLLREDLSPKPSYHALRQWMRRHSTGAGQAYTEADGRAVIRECYAGDYEISVGTDGVGKKITHRVAAGLANEVTVVLSYNP